MKMMQNIVWNDGKLRRYYYICYDYTKDGTDLYNYNKRAVYLEDYVWKSIPLGFEKGNYNTETEEWIRTFYDADGKLEVSRQIYDGSEEQYFHNR